MDRKIAVFLIVAVLVSMLAGGCKKNNSDVPAETTVVSGVTESIPSTEEAGNTKATLEIAGTMAKAGEKNVEVMVRIRNNPGLLGMDFDLYYDDSVLTLLNAESVLNLPDVFFTEPAYYRNPTTFLWDSQDVTWTEDGVVLKLSFDVLDSATAGEYEIKIMYSYGDIFDGDGAPIDMDVKNAYITVQ